MKWKKICHIFTPSGQADWLMSHASVPIAEHIGDGFFKIYFSSRDKSNRSFTGFVVIDISRPERIVDLSTEPVLSPGELGGFDDSGSMATWMTQHGDQKYLYYIGWNLGVTVPYRNSIGLAKACSNSNKFAKFSQGPIVDRSMTEPHFCASCCVLPGPDFWRMWYLSCTDWNNVNGKLRHRYHIKYAESSDGIQWERNGNVSIDYSNDSEYAISRPSVMRDKDCWRMWYSYRGQSYRIGYAESVDGLRWERIDQEAGIDVSDSGWDSQMIEYPFVFDHDGQRYLLYNGNGYGRTGFGLAALNKF